MLRFILAIAACTYLAFHGLQKGSLSRSGALAAFVLGLVTFSHPNPVFGAILLAFYLSSSKLTKWKQELKKELEEDFKEGYGTRLRGQRTATQVLSNGLTGTLLTLAHWYTVYDLAPYPPGPAPCLSLAGTSIPHTILTLAYVGHYACCNGDTWASEIGVLGKGRPRLVTTWREVPIGTNGGVSPLGFAASLAGGTLIGLIAALFLPWDPSCAGSRPFVLLIAAGTLAGIIGSLIDSLLGATLQRSTYNAATKKIAGDHRRMRSGETDRDLIHVAGIEVLDNHQVNFVSSLITAVIFAFGATWVSS
ncbi:integral membrane protein DUF92-domain-containing protein [Blyttiomyces helicus]|uniref:Integral membrane protein DUF92-domain-containing protein n=1 Tax=Blyttiomyces helicus TaxID=388810 RepID=A0A4P9W0B7_9FUNG|nr:integral membrane protein DUF92-domain-containing protein [Blyttiomyces helicus]|eukprot:RKO85514.1 integral membrane protein DUF92-domain-containing protein [Blyttiomyces helicus]